MGRRFTSASNERIQIGAAGLNGLNFLFGTIAIVATRATSGVTTNGIFATNETTGACIGLGVKDNDTIQSWDGSNLRTSTLTIPLSTTPFLLVWTKVTGTVTARVHRYNFGSSVWTHEAMSGTSPNAAATTSITLGSNKDSGSSEPWDGEIWAVALWPGSAMTDSEVERLARGCWLRTSPGLYVQWTDGREINDMTRSLGTRPCRQTGRTGTTRGVLPPPAGFGFSPVARRR